MHPDTPFARLVELERDCSYLRAAVTLMQSRMDHDAVRLSAAVARLQSQVDLQDKKLAVMAEAAGAVQEFMESQFLPITDVPDSVWVPFCEALKQAQKQQ